MLRIAPTPSGYIHKGNLFNFWLTQEWAARLGKPLLLRIDDLDRERMRDDYVDFLFEALDYFGICWDIGPRNRRELSERWSQWKRLDIYQKLFEQLKQNDRVFACRCSRKDLREAGKVSGCVSNCDQDRFGGDVSFAWRFREESAPQSWKDFDGDVQKVGPFPETRQVVLLRRDGVPAYQLASLADDLHFGISHVVRGEDLLSSTAVQMQLAKALGANDFNKIRFFHHPLLQDTKNEKLSKSVKSAPLQLNSDERKSLREEFDEWKQGFQEVGRRRGSSMA